MDGPLAVRLFQVGHEDPECEMPKCIVKSIPRLTFAFCGDTWRRCLFFIVWV